MYRLIKTEKGPSGLYRQFVKTEKGDEHFDFYGLRFALVWPTAKSPAYFVGGGSEVFDEKLEAISGDIIRVTVEREHQGIDLDSFFDTLTDYMTSYLSDTVYCDLSKEDFRETFYNYLDRRGLRNISAGQAPYSDFVLRIAKVKDCDEAGNLIIDKGSPLFGDLRGISRMDLQEEPEVKFYRLNALSMLVAGFLKYRSRPALLLKNFGKHHSGHDWRV